MTPADVAVREVRRHFSEHAGEYDRYAVVQKGVVHRLLDLLPDDGGSFGPALDLGTGTGDLARRLRHLHPGLPLVVADIAHGMTRHAAILLPDALAVDADAEALPFAAGRFGLVLSASMYQWVNDLPRAFAECRRVLRPGGLFAFALFGAGTLRELRAAHGAALAEAGSGRPSHMQQFPTLDEVREALAAAGFTAEVESVDEIEEHPDVPSLLRALKHIGAQNASIRRPSGLAARQTTLRMMAIYAERYGRSGRIPATYEVIYGLARRG